MTTPSTSPKRRGRPAKTKITKSRSLRLAVQLAQREQGACIYCNPHPDLPPSKLIPPEPPVLHKFQDWYAVHYSSIPENQLPPMDPANPHHLNHDCHPQSLDDLRNVVTVCHSHYRDLLYPASSSDPYASAYRQPRDIYADANASQDSERPATADTTLISFQISHLVHQQIKAQAAEEHITASKLYRSLIYAALPLYLTRNDEITKENPVPTPQDLFPDRRLTQHSPTYTPPLAPDPEYVRDPNKPPAPPFPAIDNPVPKLNPETLAERAKRLSQPSRPFGSAPPVIPYDPNDTDLEF